MSSGKKVKKTIALFTICHVFLSLLSIGLFFLLLWQPWLYPPLIKHYSNDTIYIETKGCISDCEKCPWLRFEWVLNESGEKVDGDTIMIYQDYAKVYSSNLEEVWQLLSPKEGMIISFVYAYGNYRGALASPIVQITYEEKEVLSFKDGKASLISYLENYGLE